jgi:hypothetical protein
VSNLRFLSVFFLAATLSFPTAIAQEKDTENGSAKKETEEVKPKGRLAERAEKRRKRIMEKYEATGEVKHCVPMRSLRQSIILGDKTIFFETIGRKGYMNQLPHECIGLMREERFAYANSFGSLCRAQIITILDSFGRSWGSCSLGSFEEYQQKPKSDSVE